MQKNVHLTRVVSVTQTRVTVASVSVQMVLAMETVTQQNPVGDYVNLILISNIIYSSDIINQSTASWKKSLTFQRLYKCLFQTSSAIKCALTSEIKINNFFRWTKFTHVSLFIQNDFRLYLWRSQAINVRMATTCVRQQTPGSKPESLQMDHSGYYWQ